MQPSIMYPQVLYTRLRVSFLVPFIYSLLCSDFVKNTIDIIASNTKKLAANNKCISRGPILLMCKQGKCMVRSDKGSLGVVGLNTKPKPHTAASLLSKLSFQS